MDKLDDIDWDDIELAQKEFEEGLLTLKTKPKSPETKISNKRSRIETESPELTNFNKRIKEAENKVLRRIPAGHFISVTSQTRTRVYLRMKEPRIQHFNEQRKFSRAFGLLSSSFSDIRNQAEKLLKKSHRENALENQELKPNSSHLWVDQFKPKSYLELLSDDGVNRSLLRWLRLWDKIVFGVSQPVRKATAQRVQAGMIKKNWPQVNQELDSNSFPTQRLALLCGPPGFGKTTLAHVIATHAGYNVIEMNASDDRSVEIFRTQIEASTQMRSVRDRRPNCLVIDEIDGAPAASINLLVAMTTTRDKKKENAVRRPIICICNDQYAPSLKMLRQHAFVIVFPPTLSSRLACRLQEISNAQKMSVELTTLLVLCDKTDNDIRSCLSTLQFINNNNNNATTHTKNQITLTDIISTSIGQKDVQRSFFSIWQEIFTIPRNTRPSFLDQSADDFHILTDKSSLATRFNHILRIVNSGGDIDKLYSGLFHNYLNLKFKKTTSSSDPISEASEWLCFVDKLQQQIYATQNYILYPYTTLGFVLFHFLFASTNRPKIEYPSLQFEMITKQNRRKTTRDSLLDQMKPSLRTYATPTALLLDILPYLSIILQPSLRPVNTQLYTPTERQQLSTLIDLMISYQLTYVQDRTTDGHYNYVLNPNIEEVVCFGDNTSKVTRILSYSAKQLIAREIELESMRRKEPVTSSSLNVQKKAEPTTTTEVSEQKPKLRERPMVDFFGRPLVTKREDGPLQRCRSGGVVEEKSTCDLWFHFKEGYSNAVRRNIRILDLM